MVLAATTAYPDGRPRLWPDGTPRSWGNCFTHCLDGEPHGYRSGSPVAATPDRARRGSRSPVAFGQLNGTYENTPRAPANIPPRRAGHLHRRPE
jgi:hypothetical protein